MCVIVCVRTSVHVCMIILIRINAAVNDPIDYENYRCLVDI